MAPLDAKRIGMAKRFKKYRKIKISAFSFQAKKGQGVTFPSSG